MKAAFPGAADLRAIGAIVRKDLTQELRSRAVLMATLFFSGVTLVIMGFSAGGDSDILRVIGPGSLWVALAFAGVITASQSWVNEHEDGALEQLLLYPVPRAVIYVGKLLANWIYLGTLALVLLPVSLALFNLDLGGRWPLIIAVLLLGTLAFAVIGSFYAALTSSLRARESLLPLLMFPVIIPALLSSVGASSELMYFEDTRLALDWLKLLVAFVLVYLVLCISVFHFLLEE